MKSIHYVLIYALCAAASINGFGQTTSARHSFRVGVSVVDDQDRPVAQADVGFSWGLIGGSKLDSDYDRKLTDGNGVAFFIGSTSSNMYSFGATKDGFYPSRGLSGNFDQAKHGQWQPWNGRLVVVLKPIKKPVAMYVKKIEAFVPEIGRPIGYDLERGDWVAPYGKGVTTDFLFTVEGSLENELNYMGVLKLQIPGEENGIQPYALDPVQRSELKLPYEAPVVGYQSDWSWHNSRRTPDVRQPSVFIDESQPQRAFIYRVRTVVDPQGRIIRANYGKIHGPIYFSPRLNGKWAIGITYYFNPDETRNLECDPKRNLFPNHPGGVEP